MITLIILLTLLFLSPPVSAEKIREITDELQEVMEDVRVSESETSYFKIISQKTLEKEDYQEIRDHLKRVRREVGKRLGIYPDEFFRVILTDPETFRNYTGSPQHVAGLFDGRIHLPVPSEVDDEFLQSILWHEYTHAVIWSYTEGKILLWLNEGIATYIQSQIEPRDTSFVIEHIESYQTLPLSLEKLEYVFQTARQQPTSMVVLAYDLAYTLADYLFKNHELYEIKRLMKRSYRTSIDQALQETMNLKETEFVRRVVKHVKRSSR